MHSLLDSEFGDGQGAFAAKSVFGYDRRLRGGGAGGGQAGAAADGNKKEGKKEEQAAT